MLRILKSQRGFTLIELVIIIILIGLLAGIAIPRYVDLREQAVIASAKATLDAGKGAVNLGFANDVLTNGNYVTIFNLSTEGAEVNATDVTDLEGLLQKNPNYPPNGTYDNPAGEGFRWWVRDVGSITTASSPETPEIDAIIDVTCVAGNSATSTADDDCFVSQL
ncbi:MAG: prepilin-type N-terminal cleavage/methylation domain-containing protein [Candidatus Methylomirabilales bacterium]